MYGNIGRPKDFLGCLVHIDTSMIWYANMAMKI